MTQEWSANTCGELFLRILNQNASSKVLNKDIISKICFTYTYFVFVSCFAIDRDNSKEPPPPPKKKKKKKKKKALDGIRRLRSTDLLACTKIRFSHNEPNITFPSTIIPTKTRSRRKRRKVQTYYLIPVKIIHDVVQFIRIPYYKKCYIATD